MRITIQALIEGVAGGEQRAETIGVVERDADCVPASGIGLFTSETPSILKQLQALALGEQTSQFVDRASRCRGCSSRFATKDSKAIISRTAFGLARLDSPRLYSRCGGCRISAVLRRSFSPLAEALPERVHPQLPWPQSRYASTMSYRMARILLSDALPAGGTAGLEPEGQRATNRPTARRGNAARREGHHPSAATDGTRQEPQSAAQGREFQFAVTAPCVSPSCKPEAFVH
jgi:hypothetical protein